MKKYDGTVSDPHHKHPECAYRMKRGWWCSRRQWHTGPCALRPTWWNLPAKIGRML